MNDSSLAIQFNTRVDSTRFFILLNGIESNVDTLATVISMNSMLSLINIFKNESICILLVNTNKT